MIESLENSYLQGQNNYPKTVTEAFNLLTNWKQDPHNMMRVVGVGNDGVSFTNVESRQNDGQEVVALANSGKKGP